MKKFVIATLMSVCMAAPAFAGNIGKYYAALDLGRATYSGIPFPNPSVIRFAGGYNFSPALAVELGYSTFGDSNTTLSCCGYATTSAASFQVVAVGKLPIDREFDLIGKLGLASNVEDYASATGFSASYSYSDLLIGFGGEYHVNSKMDVRMLYDNYGKFDNLFPPMKATSLSLGIVYNF
jgi:hypothetical protein